MARIRFAIEARGMAPTLAIQRAGARQLAAIEAGMVGVYAGWIVEMRQHIGDAFPRSARLPTTITGRAYRAEGGKPPAALIHPRAGQYVAPLLEAQMGATILPKRGKALAIPLRGVPRVGDGRTRQMTPEQYRARFGADSLVFVPPRPGQRVLGYLAAKLKAGRDYPKAAVRGRRARKPKRYQILYALVERAVLPPRLQPGPITERWTDLTPYYIEKADREMGEPA